MNTSLQYRGYDIDVGPYEIVTQDPCRWKVRVGILSYLGATVHSHNREPVETFETEDKARAFGLSYAKEIIDKHVGPENPTILRNQI